MFLKSWWLEVTNVNQEEIDEDGLFDFTGGSQAKNSEELFLSAKAEVWCPCCKQICRLKTRKHSFEGRTQALRVWQARELFEPKHCSHCGIYFSFPDQARKSLREELAKKLTEEWLDEQLRKHQFGNQP